MNGLIVGFHAKNSAFSRLLPKQVVGQAHIFAPLNPLLLRPCLNKKYNESKLCI
jgi:hypothetical protein